MSCPVLLIESQICDGKHVCKLCHCLNLYQCFTVCDIIRTTGSPNIKTIPRCYCDKRLVCSWIAQTDLCTLVFRANNRTGKVLEDMFGDTLKNITAVTDRHSTYFSLDFADHQICLTYILREVQYLTELNGNQQWSVELQNLLQEAIHTHNESPAEVIDKAPWLSRLDRLLQQSVEHLKNEFRRLKKGLIKCRDYVF